MGRARRNESRESDSRAPVTLRARELQLRIVVLSIVKTSLTAVSNDDSDTHEDVLRPRRINCHVIP